jgi:adenylate cyclase
VDPPAPAPEADPRSFLLARGHDGADVDRAEAEGWLPLLVLDELLLPGPVRLDRDEVARQAGVPDEVAERAWGAMGFPEVPYGEKVFVQDDVAALRGAAALPDIVDLGGEVRLARVVGSSMARVAEAAVDGFEVLLADLRDQGASEADIAAALLGQFDLDELEHLIGYVFRRQLHAALWRRLATDPSGTGTVQATIGFVDLVRFTALTELVAEEELAAIVDRFEQLSHDRVRLTGGRVVKMIGDAVMFVTETPMDAVRVALDLVDAYEHDDLVPPARAGVACGAALVREGDFFGPVVNLASRIVDMARPSTVVVSDDLHGVLEADETLSWRRLPRRRLKGLGSTTLWRVSYSAPSG